MVGNCRGQEIRMGGAECLTVVVAGSESLGGVGTDIGVPCLYHCKE
jgi:hypothetical protein